MRIYSEFIALAKQQYDAGLTREEMLETDIARARDSGYFRAAAVRLNGEGPGIFWSEKRFEFMARVARLALKNGAAVGWTLSDKDAFMRELELMPVTEHVANLFGEDERHFAIPQLVTHSHARDMAEIDRFGDATLCTVCGDERGRYVHLQWNVYPSFLNHYYIRLCRACSVKHLEVDVHALTF
ncbi:hypothetical protein [Serinicoccus marinus]|uniref:hypothetical protein n=1 Tax=Serinicoccus marinus TaxID=247333 RepID=UPI000527DEE5|nr:hypothetical protein [Serinicoccus marinus]